MSNALGNLFQDIADAIKEKTGNAATMKPAEFADNIRAIEIGGGSSADVRYVTFMSHDGTVEYGKKAVAVGDNCADPIARGLFDTPTRESSAQYNYTFNGWASTINGSASSTVLNAVTEDKTVYAAYTSSIRYYTITYYDGSTVLKTESLAYGTMPSYTPQKDGYGFDGWTPALAVVTGDASYTAKWTTVITFANGSWAQIAEICAAGNASTAFKVGDTKTISFTDTKGYARTTTARIWGFNHDDLAEGSGKAAMTIVLTPLVGMQESLNDNDVKFDGVTGGYSGGWGNCDMRTKLNGTVYNSLDEDLKAAIKTVKKTYLYVHNSEEFTGTSNDKLWIPSTKEAIPGTTTNGTGSSYGFSLATDTSNTITGVKTRTASNYRYTYIYRHNPAGFTTSSAKAEGWYHICFCI